MNIESIINALEILDSIEQMPLSELANEYSEKTLQNIPKPVIEEFYFTGLSNLDFLTSDFLTKKGFKNIYQDDLNTHSV